MLLIGFVNFSHDKALEAVTVCGELEEKEDKGRFSKIVEALHDDHTNLKVRPCIETIL